MRSLTIDNLSDFTRVAPGRVQRAVTVGIQYVPGDRIADAIVERMAESLQRFNVRAVYPYAGASDVVDYVAAVQTQTDYSSSGLNFLINWPGWVVFAPLWNGYLYTVEADITVDLVRTSDHVPAGRLNVPLTFDLSWTDADRGWTTLSWWVIPDFSAIAFASGIYFAVVPDADLEEELPFRLDTAVPTFVASHVANAVANAERTPQRSGGRPAPSPAAPAYNTAPAPEYYTPGQSAIPPPRSRPASPAPQPEYVEPSYQEPAPVEPVPRRAPPPSPAVERNRSDYSVSKSSTSVSSRRNARRTERASNGTAGRRRPRRSDCGESSMY